MGTINFNIYFTIVKPIIEIFVKTWMCECTCYKCIEIFDFDIMWNLLNSLISETTARIHSWCPFAIKDHYINWFQMHLHSFFLANERRESLYRSAFGIFGFKKNPSTLVHHYVILPEDRTWFYFVIVRISHLIILIDILKQPVFVFFNKNILVNVFIWPLLPEMLCGRQILYHLVVRHIILPNLQPFGWKYIILYLIFW